MVKVVFIPLEMLVQCDPHRDQSHPLDPYQGSLWNEVSWIPYKDKDFFNHKGVCFTEWIWAYYCVCWKRAFCRTIFIFIYVYTCVHGCHACEDQRRMFGYFLNLSSPLFFVQVISLNMKVGWLASELLRSTYSCPWMLGLGTSESCLVFTWVQEVWDLLLLSQQELTYTHWAIFLIFTFFMLNLLSPSFRFPNVNFTLVKLNEWTNWNI